VFVQKVDRSVNEEFFIEPTTGRKYNIEDSPYFSIQAAFNHQNFWINLDPNREIQNINMNFEEDPDSNWEFVMLQSKKKSSGDDDNGESSEHDDENQDENQEEVLDMPAPWSPKLFVNKDKFMDRCKDGEKTVFYKMCKVDYYSECKQTDGLVRRITLYKDYGRLIVKEVRSEYACRIDKLIVRRRFPYEFKLVEHYESMEDTHWKKLIQIDGHDRKLWFYHHRNKDGLIFRHEQYGYKNPKDIYEQEKNKILEKYKNRPDKLIYRSVVWEKEDKPDNQAIKMKVRWCSDEVVIKKMTQKFELDPHSFRPSGEQIRKTVFDLSTKQG
jgi:hypothetical protein